MGAVALTIPEITSSDWSLAVGDGPADGSTIGEVVQGIDDVDQCVGIICTTPQGSDPLRPTFAWDLLNIVDLPVTLAIPLIVAGLAAAIALWEPRAQVISIVATPINATTEFGAHWLITVIWQLNLGGALVPAPQKTVATIPRNN